jgi:hypothetical protein
LSTTSRAYDVITSEPPPPNNAGVVNLYAREYYRAARRVLKPGGVLAQWLPMTELSRADGQAAIGAIAAEFPYVELRYGVALQWIVLASDAPLAVDLASVDAMTNTPAVARDLASIGVRDSADLLATLIQGDAELRRVIADAEPVSDDLPSIEYPIDAIPLPIELPGFVGDPLDELALVKTNDESAKRHLTDAASALGSVLRAGPIRLIVPTELRELMYGTMLRAALLKEHAHPAILALLDVDDVMTNAARARLASQPDDGAAILLLARRAYYEDDFATADARLATMTPGPSTAAQYWLLRGGCARALGRFDAASALFARAAGSSQNPRFRSMAEKLARTASTPWSPELGPLAVTD